MEAEAYQTPGIKRSVDIIKNQLNRIGLTDDKSQKGSLDVLSYLDREDVESGGSSQSVLGDIPAMYAFDQHPNLANSDYTDANSLPWLSWEAFDVSGGFPVLDGYTWPAPAPTWTNPAQI
ncbi:hypothetical protein LTR17_007924 [Elasticomyces elasticus]|nr:hypothetical protein LTR17_007924 [Elasticomyces elasticus]